MVASRSTLRDGSSIGDQACKLPCPFPQKPMFLECHGNMASSDRRMIFSYIDYANVFSAAHNRGDVDVVITFQIALYRRHKVESD